MNKDNKRSTIHYRMYDEFSILSIKLFQTLSKIKNEYQYQNKLFDVPSLHMLYSFDFLLVKQINKILVPI